MPEGTEGEEMSAHNARVTMNRDAEMRYMQSYAHCVAQTLQALPWEDLHKVASALQEARLCRAAVFVCGNGGSAATASHFVNDLNKGANAPGVPRFRAVGLTDNVALMTAWSNDAGYTSAFVEPLSNLARPRDVLICFSCSGASANVVEAARYARELGMLSIGFTGSPGGELARLVDLAVTVPNECTEQVEDVHMFLEHALVSALRGRALRELIPSLIMADGRGATPATRAVVDDLPPRGAIFLDRDGVINANRSDYVTRWDQVELLPGALEALRMLAQTRQPIIVVTNQSAVGRGLASFEMVESINLRLMRLVGSRGGRLDAVAWCPHGPDEGCGCRKPNPGMLSYAAESLNLGLSQSYMVGDSESDVAVGMAAGCKTALVLTGREAPHGERVRARWGPRCRIVSDLRAAARWIVDDGGSSQGIDG